MSFKFPGNNKPSGQSPPLIRRKSPTISFHFHPVDHYNSYNEVKELILRPKDSKVALKLALYLVYKRKKIIIDGFTPPPSNYYTQSSPGVVSPCGHMFCVECWTEALEAMKWPPGGLTERNHIGCPVCSFDLCFRPVSVSLTLSRFPQTTGTSTMRRGLCPEPSPRLGMTLLSAYLPPCASPARWP